MVVYTPQKSLKPLGTNNYAIGHKSITPLGLNKQSHWAVINEAIGLGKKAIGLEYMKPFGWNK